MGLMELLLGPECGVDIYDEPNKDKWIACAVYGSKIRLAIYTIILVIVSMLCLVYGSGLVQSAVPAFCAGFAGSLALAHIFIVGPEAEVQYKRFQKKLQSYEGNGLSRKEAILEIKKEILKKAEIEAISKSSRGFSDLFAAGTLAAAIVG